VKHIENLQRRIDELSGRRHALRRRLSDAHDPQLVAELRELDDEIERGWSELRSVRARLRFGERDEIIARARREERLERAA
jgi:chromosome segregation ATPase